MFVASKVFQGFERRCVGTRVVEAGPFIKALSLRIEHHCFGSSQHAVLSAPALIPYVMWGEGLRSQEPSDYILRNWRGKVHPFLKRHLFCTTEKLGVVVYKTDYYLSDPEVMADDREVDRIKKINMPYVLVAIINPDAPRTADSLVHCLAGNNQDVMSWDVARIHTEAAAIHAYWNKYCVVAD